MYKLAHTKMHLRTWVWELWFTMAHGWDSTKQLGVLIHPPPWDASILQGALQQFVAGTHSENWVEKNNVE